MLVRKNIVIEQVSKIFKYYFNHYSGVSRAVWEGIFLNFIQSTIGGVFYFLSIYFVTVLKFNIETATTIISCYGIGAVLGGILGGKLSDKIQPIFVQIGSLIAQAIVFLALIQLNYPLLLMIAIFIFGTATYSFITSNHVWILNQCRSNETEKLKALNLLSSIANLGSGISAIIISIVASYNFKYIFLFCGVILIFIAMYLAFYRTARISSKAIDATQDLSSHHTNKYNRKILLTALFCVFLMGCIVAQTGTTYSVYIHDHFPQFGIKGVGILFFINTILITIFQTPIGNIFHDKNKILMVGIGAFLLGFGMFALSFSFDFMLAILACIIYTIGEMIFFPIVQLVCYESGPASKKGHHLGLFRMTYAASRIAGPALGGMIYQYHNGGVNWFVCGIFGVICLLLCTHFHNRN